MSKRQQNYTTFIVLGIITIIGLIIPWFFPSFVSEAELFWREHSRALLKWTNCISASLIVLHILVTRLNVRDGLTAKQIIVLIPLIPITLALASIPIRTMFGVYPVHDISETALNLFICIILFLIRLYWPHVVKLFTK